MYSLRRFHKLVVLAALVWLPMSVFAQICATHATLSRIDGVQHAALIAATEFSNTQLPSVQSRPPLAVGDAASFCQPVVDYDAGCDMKSMCAFASLAALVATNTDMTFADDALVLSVHEIAFSTRALTPDTPPPRG